MSNRKSTTLTSHLVAGQVYRRNQLLQHSKAIDRDLDKCVSEGKLEKVAAGVYYKPAKSRFGTLPPNDNDLVRVFLRDDQFLIYSWNQYNSLGLGLTQAYNRVVVYNRKRHGVFNLAGKQFDFRRPARGFPKIVTPEFLLVDLVNNMGELMEDVDRLKDKITQLLSLLDRKLVFKFAKEYGKVATVRFFETFEKN